LEFFTGAAPDRDFSRAKVVCINSKTGRKGLGSTGDAAAGLLMKKRQNGHLNVIFEVMSEVQKDPEDVSAGIGPKKSVKFL
jgi:hypothetical protein